VNQVSLVVPTLLWSPKTDSFVAKNVILWNISMALEHVQWLLQTASRLVAKNAPMIETKIHYRALRYLFDV